jgi:hypothetical protein
VLVGGQNVANRLADAWEWDGTAWKVVVVASASTGRSAAAVVSDPQGAGIVMLAGEIAGNGPYGDGAWDHVRLRWDTDQRYEECHIRIDVDGDSTLGCDDPDCWARCTPLCPPGTSCDPAAPQCGDHVCNTSVEDCRICPTDCTCTVACGDTFCDSGETQASCPGDCTP